MTTTPESPSTQPTVTVTVTLTEALARCLASNSTRNFTAEQPDRFERMDGTGGSIDIDVRLCDGTMFWCATVADLLLLQAFEQGCGYITSIAYDPAVAFERSDGTWDMGDPYVVISSRLWT